MKRYVHEDTYALGGYDLPLRFLDQAVVFLVTAYAAVSLLGMDRLPSALISLAAILAVVRHYRSPLNLPLDPAIRRAIFFYLGVLVLSGAAAYPDIRWEQVWSFADRMLTLPLVLCFFHSRLRLTLLLTALCVSAVIADFIGIWQYLHNMARITSLFDNPIPLAEHLMLLLAFLLPLVFSRDSAQNHTLTWLIFTCLILSLLVLLLTQTRAAWVGFVGAWFIYLLFSRQRRRSFILLSLVAFSLLAMAFLFSPGLQDRLSSIIDVRKHPSNTERILVWRASLQMLGDHPWLGVGPDNYGEQYLTHYISPVAIHNTLRDAHNNYLHVLAETGLIGFGAYMALFIVLLRYFYRRYRQSPNPAWPLAALLMLVAFSVYGLMNTLWVRFWPVRYLFLLLGLAIAAEKVCLSAPINESTQNRSPDEE